MYEVKTTQAFDQWLHSLEDVTKGRLLLRLTKVGLGLLGDVESVGDGVYELKEHFGPGYRMYYIKEGKDIILLLGGGDKSTQKKDIKQAKKAAEDMQ